MVIKILYPKQYSTPVCQYTSVFPENNVKDRVNKMPKVVPVGCIGLWKHNGVLNLNLEKLGKQKDVSCYES